MGDESEEDRAEYARMLLDIFRDGGDDSIILKVPTPLSEDAVEARLIQWGVAHERAHSKAQRKSREALRRDQFPKRFMVGGPMARHYANKLVKELARWSPSAGSPGSLCSEASDEFS